MIHSLTLKKFTAFSDLNIQFSPKLNILIGENGTGKSLLLKAAYTLCSASREIQNLPSVNNEDIEREITAALFKIFLPLDGNIGNLHKSNAVEKTELSASFIYEKKSLFV